MQTAVKLRDCLLVIQRSRNAARNMYVTNAKTINELT